MFYLERRLDRKDFLKLFPRHSIGAGQIAPEDEFSKDMLTVIQPREFHVLPRDLNDIPDQSLDWIYFHPFTDVEQAGQELALAGRKMKENGLITGYGWNPDDYDPLSIVNIAVYAFCRSSHWKIIYRDPHTQWCLGRQPTFY